MDAFRIKKSAVTLIELLIAIGVATLLIGVTVMMLQTGFESYSYGHEDALLDKILQDCLDEISGAGFEVYGIKDALEILKITPDSITFVPLWVDDTHTAKFEHSRDEAVAKIPFTLNRPLKRGSALPIAEVLAPDEIRRKAGRWKTIPITFIAGAQDKPFASSSPDRVFLNQVVEPGSKIRFVFHPDTKNFPDSAMTIKWLGNKVLRTYKGKTETIPKYNLAGVALSGLKFRYFDNTNHEVEPETELIPNLTAVEVSLTASIGKGVKAKNPKSRRNLMFINLRNTRTSGKGLIIRQGTRLKIPDSKHIRVFSLSNMFGTNDAGRIEFEARPQRGSVWRLRIELGSDRGAPLLKKYSIEYPPGNTVYSETINLTNDIPLNFMNLGANGRYDYDFDKDGNNAVNLEGDVELWVTRMDADGATLFIRP